MTLSTALLGDFATLQKQGLLPQIIGWPANVQDIAQGEIPQRAEKFALVNFACFTTVFKELVYNVENNRGLSLINHIITRLSSPPANEPRAAEVLVELQALGTAPNIKTFFPKHHSQPLTLARTQFRLNWIKAIAKACDNIEHIETLQSWVETAPKKQSVLEYY